MTNPAVLMLKFSMKFQNESCTWRSMRSSPRTSMVPMMKQMMKQMAIDRPVLARLRYTSRTGLKKSLPYAPADGLHLREA